MLGVTPAKRKRRFGLVGIFILLTIGFTAAGILLALFGDAEPVYRSDEPGREAYILIERLYGPALVEKDATWFVALDSSLHFTVVRLDADALERCAGLVQGEASGETVRVSGTMKTIGTNERAALIEAFNRHTGSTVDGENFESYFGTCYLDAGTRGVHFRAFLFVPAFLSLLILTVLSAGARRKARRG